MCCILIRNPYLIILAKVIFICLLSFIPWPPRTVKIQCSRDSTRIVRKIIQAKLTPIFQKYNIDVPIECPLHPKRDLFLPQENAKIRHRATQFTCGLCGKSFYEERHLDMHFDNRHRNHLNNAEDAICLADYCDILRCDVLVTKDSSIGSIMNSSPVSTDIELYNEATALAAARREVVKSHMSSNSFKLPPTLKEKLNDLLAATGHKIEIPQPKEKIHKRKRNLCNGNVRKGKTEDESNIDKSNNTENDSSNSTCESAKFGRLSDVQKLKANCKSDEIHKLKTRCEQLIRTCVASALVKLSTEDFKSMENEMNKQICWYLTCERYWEDTTSRPFPFALVFILVVVLSLGICLCYYIIWILFDTDESTSSYNLLTTHSNYQQPLQSSVASMHGSNLITSSSSLPHFNSNIYPQTTSIVQSQSSQPLEQIPYTDEFPEHEQYIYVQTYQHHQGGGSDLKNRLSSDSFYNRTSRI